MMPPISVAWCLSPNFGDALAPWLARRISGRDVIYADFQADYEHYVISGSVLNHAGPKSIVWGAGLASMIDNVDPRCRIHAVRGPLSRVRAMTCGHRDVPPIYGDPALLLPRWFPDPVEPCYEVGIVPHYVDAFRVHSWFGSDERVKIVDLLAPVESVVEQIRSCRKIVSSALHGIVLADAFSIPRCRVLLSDSVGGDGMKFHDHDSTVGIEPSIPLDWREKKPQSLVEFLPWRTVPVETVARLRESLWSACPLPRP